MVRAWGGDNIALPGDLTGEAGDWAGDLVDLAEEEDTGKAARCALASGSRGIDAYGVVRMTKPHGRKIDKVIDTRERAHAYALGYWGMVGWKIKILMELSTPLTVVVTSAWDSLMSMVAGGSSRYVVNFQYDLIWDCATTPLSREWPELRML